MWLDKKRCLCEKIENFRGNPSVTRALSHKISTLSYEIMTGFPKILLLGPNRCTSHFR